MKPKWTTDDLYHTYYLWAVKKNILTKDAYENSNNHGFGDRFSHFFCQWMRSEDFKEWAKTVKLEDVEMKHLLFVADDLESEFEEWGRAFRHKIFLEKLKQWNISREVYKEIFDQGYRDGYWGIGDKAKPETTEDTPYNRGYVAGYNKHILERW